MDHPNKRFKPSPTENDTQDFVPLDFSTDVENNFGYGKEDRPPQFRLPTGESRAGYRQHDRRVLQDRRHAQDKPKSKHTLPGNTTWILIRTKFGRRFVHNVQTKQSFWRIPADVLQSVVEFDERQPGADLESKSAARPPKAVNAANNQSNDDDLAHEQTRSRRRRSESLQREDEAALLAELAREPESEEEQETKQALEKDEEQQPQPGEVGYDSEGSYEYVEVTDDEGDDEDHDSNIKNVEGATGGTREEVVAAATKDTGPVEFGEDDIAYQLAAMGEDYGLDAGEYGNEEDYDEWEDGAEGLPLSNEDATNLFRDMLEDHRISPFTPWDQLLSDISPNSILDDDRFTVLTSSKARKQVWDAWVKEKAARIQAERANIEKREPRIPYLAFLAEKATPKLYWPEFRRKYKRDAEMTDRSFSDKEREKLYREHINRLKLPESTRKADLRNLLQSIPLQFLNCSTTLEMLPQQLLTNINFISLPPKTRDLTIESHLRNLPPAPDAEGVDAETLAEQEKKRAQRTKRELALAKREKRVEMERRNAEKGERFAKRDLREEEAKLSRALATKSDGLKNLIDSNDR
nr:pre-mrna-splicing factor dre4 [Quercus suber]